MAFAYGVSNNRRELLHAKYQKHENCRPLTDWLCVSLVIATEYHNVIQVCDLSSVEEDQCHCLHNIQYIVQQKASFGYS